MVIHTHGIMYGPDEDDTSSSSNVSSSDEETDEIIINKEETSNNHPSNGIMETTKNKHILPQTYNNNAIEVSMDKIHNDTEMTHTVYNEDSKLKQEYNLTVKEKSGHRLSPVSNQDSDTKSLTGSLPNDKFNNSLGYDAITEDDSGIGVYESNEEQIKYLTQKVDIRYTKY